MAAAPVDPRAHHAHLHRRHRRRPGRLDVPADLQPDAAVLRQAGESAAMKTATDGRQAARLPLQHLPPRRPDVPPRLGHHHPAVRRPTRRPTSPSTTSSWGPTSSRPPSSPSTPAAGGWPPRPTSRSFSTSCSSRPSSTSPAASASSMYFLYLFPIIAAEPGHLRPGRVPGGRALGHPLRRPGRRHLFRLHPRLPARARRQDRPLGSMLVTDVRRPGASSSSSPP
ncbi:MAG: hypothetical protein MZU91_00790 [Desulfosudis oleivorans]|nr:hypothetical protein [Desulfosudis oleivorans]